MLEEALGKLLKNKGSALKSPHVSKYPANNKSITEFEMLRIKKKEYGDTGVIEGRACMVLAGFISIYPISSTRAKRPRLQGHWLGRASRTTTCLCKNVLTCMEKK